MVSGVMNKVRGGNFGNGFMSTFFSTIAGGVRVGGQWVQGVFQTMVGGTASAIGGGKFANGAVSSAMVYLFNDSASKGTYPSKDEMIKVDLKQLRAMRVLSVMERSQRFSLRGLSPLSWTEASAVVAHMEATNGKILDTIGLGLSVGSAISPQGRAIKFGGMAIGIDIMQTDMNGTAIGVGALYKNSITSSIDIGYGVWQVIK